MAIGNEWVHDEEVVRRSLAKFFVFKLPEDQRIERVYWALEGAVVRVWTIIDRPDYEFEKSIYEAQLRFMDAFQELECDFSVIYRLGRPVEYFGMEGARLTKTQSRRPRNLAVRSDSA
ncbi:hypothetical protein MELA_02158 [Candidatus Methylomirabilis lanthanidiphila]|uniref:Uncharacterized protein n=1 Tax=Candidatus Methylomirabilis lanthanidiphila TaxID=2211376 RepID=A0A564ZKS1_9BACT|nr:hypothetical protein [Candidatus Methylomirabilis lanthanidiphila]VUZ85773.1 hypothetical protein MELA_02158 [Candidatus Methylomirabilis lanthanidiphila]